VIAKKVTLWSLAVLLGITALTATGVGLSAGLKAFKRAEQRADAENRIRLTRIETKRARAQIATTEAQAQARYRDAVGRRRAQDEIRRTLTGRYLQYQAIQAQKSIGTSGRNNTLIYLPSGSSGVPLVQDPQNVNRLRR
jgi:Sec-independent protein translocase protein TatA